LDWSVDGDVGYSRSHEQSSGAHLIDVDAGARFAGGVAKHGDARFDAEARGGFGGGDGDVGELFGGGVGDDGAVAVDEHAVGERHEEDAGDDGYVGCGFDDFEGGAQGEGGGVGGAGDHSVGESEVHHE